MAQSRHRKKHKKKQQAWRDSRIHDKKLVKEQALRIVKQKMTADKEQKDAVREVRSKYASAQRDVTDNLLDATMVDDKPVTLAKSIPPQMWSQFEVTIAYENHWDAAVEETYFDEKPWPGTHKNVKTWFVLNDGYAVGVNIFRGKISFPEFKLSAKCQQEK